MTAIFRRAIGSRAASIVETSWAARWARCLAATVMVASAAAVTHAPAAAQSAGFSDVTGGFYKPAVDALAALGTFEGTLCGDDTFCPDKPLKRSTMAVWVVRVLDGADPSPILRSRFDDVDGDSFYAPFIERMADLGVTEGCGDGSGFCPDSSVSRAQMAVFLSRAFKLPAAPDPSFVDVASDAWYAGHVARLAASGITTGCGDGSGFCPDSNTTRAQMATFLHRGLGLVETPEAEPVPETGESDDEAFLNDHVSNDQGSAQHRAWWRRPRGNLRVKLHVCAERGFEHLFSPSDLTAYADAANEQIAPFYSWQSSGLLSVQFEPGQIVASEILADMKHYTNWKSVMAPEDCFTVESNIGQPGVVHHYLLYGEDYETRNRGLALLAGPRSATYLRHHLSAGPNPLEITPDRLFVLQHELDHNINAPHLNGAPLGNTRVWASERSRPITVGTLAGYPDIPRLKDSGLDEAGELYEVYSVFPCYVLVRLGWPMGDHHPACGRWPPPPVRDVAAQTDPDGTFRVTWRPPSSDLNPEPVTGYEIELLEWRGNVGEPTNTFRVSSDTTSLTLPSLELYVPYGVNVWATSAAGVGDLTWPVDIRYYGPAAQIRVADRSGTEWAAYDLSWDPVPGASHYLVSGFEDCTYTFENSPDGLGRSSSVCSQRTETASITLSEAQNHLEAGRSYEITVFACGEGFDETRLQWPDAGDCFAYGTTTIDAQARGFKAVEFALIDGCVWFQPGAEMDEANAAGPCYIVEWVPSPGATEYDAVAWLCPNDGGPCRGEGLGAYDDSYSISDAKVTARLDLEYGKRYEVTVDVDCRGPADTGTCFRYARGWVTVPARGN